MNFNFLITRAIYENNNISQRTLAESFCVSLGKINQEIKKAVNEGLIEKGTGYSITKKGKEYVEKYKVDSAIIFACGMGVRLKPLTIDTPKSFIEIKNEKMIERQIEQLKQVGIDDITIMVGYLKEKFDYLIDKYGVKLVYNEEYKSKNTLSTFYHAIEYIKNKNVYICVSDVYYTENLFHRYECEPYYIGEFYEDCSNEWRYITNTKNEIKKFELNGENDYCLVGHSFLTKDFSKKLIPLIEKYYKTAGTENYYWENVLEHNFGNLPTIYVYKIDKKIIYEFDSISDIQKFDKEKTTYGSEAFTFVSNVLGVKEMDIIDISCIKEGMTNHSYKFRIKTGAVVEKNKYNINIQTNVMYIARIPGEGTDKFVDRENEYNVYKKLEGEDFIEEVIYFDKKKGYKISKLFENAKTLDIENVEELQKAMALYRKLHSLKRQVKGSCDIIDKVKEYLNIIKNKNVYVPYTDFDESLEKIQKVMEWVKSLNRPKTLCHGDPNPGNVLFTDTGVKLIDLEYAGMADSLSDIALFGVYVEFSVEKTLKLFDMYVETDKNVDIGIDRKTAEKLIVAYMVLGGIYDTLWALVREAVGGDDYGCYGMSMYRVFKNSYEYFRREDG